MKYAPKNTRLNLEALSEKSLKLCSHTELCVHFAKYHKLHTFFQQDLDLISVSFEVHECKIIYYITK